MPSQNKGSCHHPNPMGFGVPFTAGKPTTLEVHSQPASPEARFRCTAASQHPAHSLGDLLESPLHCPCRLKFMSDTGICPCTCHTLKSRFGPLIRHPLLQSVTYNTAKTGTCSVLLGTNSLGHNIQTYGSTHTIPSAPGIQSWKHLHISSHLPFLHISGVTHTL